MKKILIAAAMAFVFLEGAKAQFIQDLFNSSNQQLVKQAVGNGIVLLRQDYQLLDTLTHVRYGWNHQETFNSVYSIGFKVEGGYVVTDAFVNPWNADTRYQELHDTPYVPVVSKSYLRLLEDSVMTEFTYDRQYCHAIKDGFLYRIDSIAHEQRGFKTDRSPGEKDGWLVWIAAADSNIQSNTEIQPVIYRQKLTVEADKLEYELPNPNTTQSVIGGFYLMPQNEKIGLLDFQIVGYALLKEGKWYIVEESASQLTPILVEGGDNMSGEKDAGTSKKENKKRK